MFIGFTGTPLLKADKEKSIEIFGRYIHTYKFDEAVKDGVVLDLRYEARDIDQDLTSQAKIDQWFEAKTKGLTDLAKAQLKKRWGTMQKVLSSRVAARADRRRHPDGHGDQAPADGAAGATPCWSSGSIYQACKFYELFCQAGFKGKCAIVTSLRAARRRHQREDRGEGADREAAAVRHLPADAGRLVQRAGRHRREQGRDSSRRRSRRSSSTSRAR